MKSDISLNQGQNHYKSVEGETETKEEIRRKAERREMEAAMAPVPEDDFDAFIEAA